MTVDLEEDPESVDRLLSLLISHEDSNFHLDVLTGMNQALEGWRRAPMPADWRRTADLFTRDRNAAPEIVAATRQLSVVFGDGRAVAELRQIALNPDAEIESRRNALDVLIQDRGPELLPLLKKLLHDRALLADAVRGLAAFDGPDIPGMILARYGNLDPTGQSAAIDTLASRPNSAHSLLEAIRDGELDRHVITAFHARQIHSLGDASISRLLEQVWGEIRDTDDAKQEQIVELESRLSAEYLADADLSAGRRLFEKSCGKCHVLYGEGGRIGPDLTGSNRHNLRYLLQNVIDPNATLSRDFKVSVVLLEDGRSLTGIVVEQRERTIVLQTPDKRLVIDRGAIDEIVPQNVSLMPTGLLKQLNDSQVRDLFAYLAGRSQVPLKGDR